MINMIILSRILIICGILLIWPMINRILFIRQSTRNEVYYNDFNRQIQTIEQEINQLESKLILLQTRYQNLTPKIINLSIVDQELKNQYEFNKLLSEKKQNEILLNSFFDNIYNKLKTKTKLYNYQKYMEDK